MATSLPGIPTVTAVTDDGLFYSIGDTATFTVTFSETVTGVSANSFSVTNGTISSVSQIGSTDSYFVVVSPGLGPLALSLVANNGIKDTEGNAALAADLSSLDTVYPIITDSDPDPNPPPTVTAITDNVSGDATAGQTIRFTVKFSEAVVGASVSSFSATNGTVSKVTPVENTNSLIVEVVAKPVTANSTIALSLAQHSGILSEAYAIEVVAADLSSFDKQPLKPPPVLAAPTVALANDTGSSANDNITQDATLKLGGVKTGAMVEYSKDGLTWSNTPPTPRQGGNTVHVRQTDAAGNVSAASKSLTFIYDTVAKAPVITLANDTGSSASDKITGIATLKLGGVETGAVVQYSSDNLHWSDTAPGVVQGSNTVYVHQTDVAGNVSAAKAFTFTYDTTAPTVNSFSPADGSTDAAVDGNIVLTFSEAVARGTGDIVLKDSVGTLIESFDAATSSRLSIVGATLVIDPSKELNNLTQYFVSFGSGTINDLAGNGYAGTNIYDFTTQNLHIITGTHGEDTLIGTADNEWLKGLAGDDTLLGLAGSDILDGGAGNDIMVGGKGDDTYIVDGISDVVAEKANQGTDTVQSSVGHTLSANVENLMLTGSNAINGTGNTQNNVIIGNAGNNILTGGAGADTLTGGLGADTFLFNSTADSTVGAGRDVITDFVSGSDKIDLSVIDASTTASGDQAFSYIGKQSFSGVAGELHFQTSTGANPAILSGDVNGDKVADFEIGLVGVISLVSADLVL